LEVSLDELKEIAKICVDSELQMLYLELGDVRLALSKTDASLPLLRDLIRGGGTATEPAAEAATASPPAAPSAGSRPDAPQAAAAAPAPPAPAAADHEGLTAVTAPTLGVYYRRASPEQPPFVEVGTVVKAGDTVCLIEVMKTYTRVEAPCAGRVAELAVEDGAMVEFGQTLMWIDPR